MYKSIGLHEEFFLENRVEHARNTLKREGERNLRFF